MIASTLITLNCLCDKLRFWHHPSISKALKGGQLFFTNTWKIGDIIKPSKLAKGGPKFNFERRKDNVTRACNHALFPF